MHELYPTDSILRRAGLRAVRLPPPVPNPDPAEAADLYSVDEYGYSATAFAKGDHITRKPPVPREASPLRKI